MAGLFSFEARVSLDLNALMAKAQEKAKLEASRLYPPHQRGKREETERRLSLKYFREYTRP